MAERARRIRHERNRREEALLLRLEPGGLRRELPLRAAAKVIEGASVAELLEHARAHVRRAGDRGSVAELVAHPPHRRCDRPRRVGLRGRRAMLGQGDRRREAPAPRAEVLRRESAAEVLGEVLVQERRRQVAEAALVLEPEQARPAGEARQLLDRVCELGIDERRPDERAVLGAEREPQARPAHVDVTLEQRGHAVGPGAAGVGLRADPEPGPVDQRDGVGERPLGAERLEPDVARHGCPQPRQELAEAHEAVVLRLLLRRAEVGVVEVLLPPGRIDARRLELRTRIGRDPHLLPGGWDDELVDPGELGRIRDRSPRARPRSGTASCRADASLHGAASVSRPFDVCTRASWIVAGSSIRGLRRADATNRAPEPR